MAAAHAATRAAVGITLLVAPSLGRSWFGSAADAGGGRVAMQAFAVRDAAIGAGILHGLRRGHPVKPWFRLGLALETTDALATLVQRPHLPDTRFPDAIALFALSGIIGGAAVGFLLEE
jgi:hypothetical protein